jgi:diaminohydroxyphosphoribosylaminopyrimidine deaminase/5-amino-6-(5-phosphoribosylamino)uracil reductase
MHEFQHKEQNNQQDYFYMDKVLKLAQNGVGHVNPNPLVGAIIVQNGKIIGEGYHQKFGEAHAEINAIKNVSESINNATLYVNLEPCSHTGKTPSCAKEIIKHNFKRIVIANIDPNPLVAGKGIEMLRNAGIHVDVGIQEKKAEKLNAFFFKFIQTNRPYVMLKTAMSLDGKIATKDGDSKWITCEESRNEVHKFRHQYAAILTGINTVIADDPLLNTRIKLNNPAHPVRIILDPKGRTPLKSQILNSSQYGKVYIAISENAKKENINKLKSKGVEIIVCPLKEGNFDLIFLLEKFSKIGLDSIMIEAGGNTNFECIRQNIVDKLTFFVSPQIIGGQNTLTAFEGIGFNKLQQTKKFKSINYKSIAEDILIEVE